MPAEATICGSTLSDNLPLKGIISPALWVGRLAPDQQYRIESFNILQVEAYQKNYCGDGHVTNQSGEIGKRQTPGYCEKR